MEGPIQEQTLIGDSDSLPCHHSKQCLGKLNLFVVGNDLFHQLMTGCMFSPQFFSQSTKVLSRRALGNFIAYHLFWSCSLGSGEAFGIEVYISLNKRLGPLMSI